MVRVPKTKTPKTKEISHLTRKIDGNFYTGVKRYPLKTRAKALAERLRQGAKGIGHRARVIEMKTAPEHAVFVDGIREK